MTSDKIRNFEDLEAWKIGRKLTNSIYSLTRKTHFSKDFGLADQIRRASVSVMTNVAEGFERGTNKDFVKFLFISRGSAGEVRSLLYVAQDQGYLNEKEFSTTHDLCIQAARIIWGLIKSLRSKSGWVTGLKILIVGLLIKLSLVQL